MLLTALAAGAPARAQSPSNEDVFNSGDAQELPAPPGDLFNASPGRWAPCSAPRCECPAAKAATLAWIEEQYEAALAIQDLAERRARLLHKQYLADIAGSRGSESGRRMRRSIYDTQLAEQLAEVRANRASAERWLRCMKAWVAGGCSTSWPNFLPCYEPDSFASESAGRPGPTEDPTTRPEHPRPRPPRPSSKCAAPVLTPDIRTRPPVTICNARELASLVFDRYETGLPIGIARVRPADGRPAPRPTYVVLLQGMEWGAETGTQGTSVMEAVLEANAQASYYHAAVVRALEEMRVGGADLLIAGHSLGGMVATNLVLSGDVTRLGAHSVRVVTFGAPGERALAPAPEAIALTRAATVRFEAERDAVIDWVQTGTKYGTIRRVRGCRDEPIVGTHRGYDTCRALEAYDAAGQPGGDVCLEVDRASLRAFPVPNSRALFGQAVGGASEDVGERGMEREAARRGYETLLSPRESSYPQGFDGVYFDPKTCSLVVGEAKGGYNGASLCSLLGFAYGHRQGTIGWVKGAGMRIVKSRTAGDTELRYAMLVLEELASGRTPVRVEVFHTENVDGQAGTTKHYVTARSSGCRTTQGCECL